MSTEKSKLGRILHLYQLLEKQVGAFDTFLEIIRSEGQTAAYQILQGFVNNLCANSNKTLFHSPIPEVVDFVSCKTRILIITTPDQQVSLKRTQDTVSKSVIVEDVNAEKVGKQLHELAHRSVLVLSCNNLSLDSVLHEVRQSTKKVIIVTEMDSAKIHAILASIRFEVVPAVASEKIGWDDINPSAQDTILSQPIIFQGDIMTLKDLPISPSKITEKLLLDLLTGKCPELVRNTVPALPDFPLKRQLSVTRKISRDVVKHTQRDIFVFKDANLEELGTLAEEKPPLESTYALMETEKVAKQVILLEREEHVELICALAEHPVHLLSYGHQHLTWICSYGSQNVILEHLLHEQNEEISEEKFIEECTTSNFPVCIAGESGMGKSVMLAKVGEAILSTDPKCVVCYVVLKDLMPHLEHKSLDSIFDVIAEHSSDYDLGREIVKIALTTTSVKCHVLLDGHGETSENENAEIVVRHIANSTRENGNGITITSRKPLQQLSVGTFAFALKQIAQKDILISCWKRNRKVAENANLEKFAEVCLNNLDENMTDFEKGISENISLCQLLADVHLQEAIDFSTRREVHGEHLTPSTITSFFELHRRFTDSCFEDLEESLTDQNYDEATIDAIQEAHMFCAIDLLYEKEDNRVKGFKKEFYRRPSAFFVYSGEMIRMKDKSFAYRSIAEYLVGLLVVKLLKRSQFRLTRSLANFLFGTVLATLDVSETILNVPSLEKSQAMSSCDFKNSAVCYFLNLLLKCQEYDGPQFDSIRKESKIISFHKILVATVFRNFQFLGKLIIRVLSKDESIFWQPDWPKLLLLTAKYADGRHVLTFVTELADLLEKNSSTELSYLASEKGFEITPLHVAIQRGNICIMEFLLNRLKFQNVLEDSQNDRHRLLQLCVYDSQENATEVIANKTKIIEILCKQPDLKLYANNLVSKGDLQNFSVHGDLVDALNRFTAGSSTTCRQFSEYLQTPNIRSSSVPQQYKPPDDVVVHTRGEDKIKSLVVGSTDCSLEAVLGAFRHELDTGILCEKLLEVALSLKLPQGTITELKKMLGQGEYHLGCDKILRTWTGAQGKKATLGVLMEALAISHQTKLCENLMDCFNNVGSS